MEAGEELQVLQKTTETPVGIPSDSAQVNQVRTRLQQFHLGELMLKTHMYIQNVRKTKAISDEEEKFYLDRALQLGLKLQNKQLTMLYFWRGMGNIVEDLQNILAKRHMEIGIEEVVARISDVENRIGLRNITQ